MKNRKINIRLNNILESTSIELINRLDKNTSERGNFYLFIKRLTDIIISTIIIIALLPLWMIIFLLIKINPGPVFYRPIVIGKDGRKFQMYKFRTMHKDSSTRPHEEYVTKLIAENGKMKKLRNDPRITPFGAILRRFSIDEFPQLLNVLKGEMSLVGPRPCMPYEFEVMKEWHKKRVIVKPGMTGLWQIRGRDLSTFNEQIKLDLYYVINRSLLLDFIILLKTITVVIFGKGGR